MHNSETIYILGAGAVGFPLAVHLANARRSVVAVRTRRNDLPKSTITVTVQDGTDRVDAPIETVSLSNLKEVNGLVVIAAKSYVNEAIVLELKNKGATGPLVIMQNGIGVEK